MILIDTHVLIWWLDDKSEKLSNKAKQEIQQAYAHGIIYVSAISFWETALLEKKGKILLHPSSNEWFNQSLKHDKLQPLAITPRIAISSVDLEFSHTDPADRIILATALEHNLPLITKDNKLQNFSRVKTIW